MGEVGPKMAQSETNPQSQKFGISGRKEIGTWGRNISALKFQKSMTKLQIDGNTMEECSTPGQLHSLAGNKGHSIARGYHPL